MKFRDIFWLSYKDLNEKRVRTALTIIMVMIGVAAIIALVSLTTGISQSIQASLQSLGPTSIILTSTKSTGFSLSDVDGILSLPNVSSVTPLVEGSGTLVSTNENESVTVVGISQQGLEQLLGGTPNLYQGSVYNSTISPASLIGYTLAFPSTTGGRQNLALGQPFTLRAGGRRANSYSIPIAGILQSYSSAIIPINTAVFMPLQAAEDMLGRSSFNTLLVKSTNTSSVSSLTTELTDIYGNNARVISTQQLAATASSIIGSITVLLILIAGISLLVAAIGIMNIMLMSVLERTHEIGIMKSLGFKQRDVLYIFLIQALLIGFVGGIVGIGVGTGASYALAIGVSHSSPNTTSSSSSSSFGAGSSPGRFGGGEGAPPRAVAFGRGSPSSSRSSGISFTPALTIGTVVEALLVAMLVSMFAGLYPAWRASKMEPIEALRQL